MNIIVKVLKWILKAVLWFIIGILCLILITGTVLYIRQYVPNTARERIMDTRFGFSKDIPDFPSFRTVKYSWRKCNYGARFGLQEDGRYYPFDHLNRFEYVLKFTEPLDQAILARIDSLVAVDEQHNLGGWRYYSASQEYCYFFDDIAKDVMDSLFISKNGKKARFVTVY